MLCFAQMTFLHEIWCLFLDGFKLDETNCVGPCLTLAIWFDSLKKRRRFITKKAEGVRGQTFAANNVTGEAGLKKCQLLQHGDLLAASYSAKQGCGHTNLVRLHSIILQQCNFWWIIYFTAFSCLSLWKWNMFSNKLCICVGINIIFCCMMGFSNNFHWLFVN